MTGSPAPKNEYLRTGIFSVFLHARLVSLPGLFPILRNMLLTSLEIKGFKSFGDKVTFQFGEGVTAIVGPNGSGKSNVVDALRWVLGEQSTRMLRSEKMENIIFNGTRTRRPLQMAEVAVTFKNTRNLLPTEYTEVTVSRRYYRSGEGEYLLNGIPCRLKDISALFMDTGIGPDSYAIIELKMVDEILNDQNNSRRQLFEEAAGVSRFKQRRKETLKKLAETDADLERVEDLLFEISKNLKTLEKQARQAEAYFRLKDEYRHHSICMAVKLAAEQLEKVRALQTRQEQYTDEQAALDAQVAALEAATEKEKAAILQKENLLASRQKTLNEHVHRIRQYESEKKIKSERLRFLSERIGSLEKQIEEDSKSNARARFSLDSLAKEKEQVEKMLAENTFLLERYQKDYEAQKAVSQGLTTRMQELAAQVKGRQNHVYQLRKNLEIQQVQLSVLRQEMDRESSDTSARQADLAAFDEKILTLEQLMQEREIGLQEAIIHQENTQQAIAETDAALARLKEELARNQRLSDSSQNEYNLTKSMVDNLEGYPQAIKFLKKSQIAIRKAPLLSDLVSCEERYRVAVENFLEPYLNYYVVASEAEALEAIQLLSDAAKGKANFFLLDRFQGFQPAPLLQFEDALPAFSVVEYDPAYRYLVGWLFEQVYIIHQNQHTFPPDEQVTFLTQNGKVIKRKRSISGGSVGLFEGKVIGRARNLEKLAAQIKELEKKTDALQTAIAERQQDLQKLRQSNLSAEISRLKDQLSATDKELATVRTRKEQFLILLQESANKRELMLEKIAQASEALELLRPTLKDEEELLADLDAQQEDLQDDINRAATELSFRQQQYNQQNILFHQQTSQVESLEKEMGYKETAYTRLVARLESNMADLENLRAEMAAVEQAGNTNDQELQDLYAEKEAIELGVHEAEKDYYNSRAEIAEAEKLVRETARKREGVQQMLMQIRETSAQVRMELNAVKERLAVEFEADLEQAAQDPAYHSDFSAEFLKEQVAATRQKIDRMGAINHMAVEAYKEIKERFDFISAQKADLLAAKDSLNKTIGEIDTVAKETFMAAFTQIRTNFIEVFRSLFTEDDSCDLLLAEPDDPLHSRIEITARPKGKRPLTINQLSGGEKTLTATALLFAIYLLKPAPFCIFDEVDAPLDDANIDKFNNIIRKFSARSQFIIVTHNKRTMASTDVMYGVTMIEQGVTTVVPVDLREVK